MSKKTRLLYITVVLFALTVYMVMNKEWFIREHLANTPETEKKEEVVPTVYTLNKRLETTEKKLDDLASDFKKTNDSMQLQSQRAAAAQATLQAIPTV